MNFPGQRYEKISGYGTLRSGGCAVSIRIRRRSGCGARRRPLLSGPWRGLPPVRFNVPKKAAARLFCRIGIRSAFGEKRKFLRRNPCACRCLRKKSAAPPEPPPPLHVHTAVLPSGRMRGPPPQPLPCADPISCRIRSPAPSPYPPPCVRFRAMRVANPDLFEDFNPLFGSKSTHSSHEKHTKPRQISAECRPSLKLTFRIFFTSNFIFQFCFRKTRRFLHPVPRSCRPDERFRKGPFSE